jgi:hypothetical protein
LTDGCQVIVVSLFVLMIVLSLSATMAYFLYKK